MENSPFSWFSCTLPRFLLLLGILAMEMAASCVLGLGSMGPMAASYGENGPTLCGIKPASSNSPGNGISSSSSASGSSASDFAECYGDDAAIVYGAPLRMAFRGLSAGAGFVCGIQALSSQPYCWGNSFYVQMGVPQSLPANVKYSEISAGDHHFCALRSSSLIVDCWGYNMTGSFRFDSPLRSITAGSIFNCAIFVHNGSAACWGDDTASGVISTLPKHERFRALDAGGYYVCGISVFSGRTVCWGKSMPAGPKQKLSFIAGGRFQACGILAQDRRVFCWGLALPGNPTNPPADARFSALVAGDYFTCGLLENSWKTVCWGGNCPRNSPLAVVPGICSDRACGTGSYADWKLCQKPLQMCLPCSDGACPEGMTEIVPCSARSDRQCGYDCRNCNAGSQCEQHCSRRKKKFLSLKGLLIVAALSCFIICLSLVVFLIAFCMRLKSFKPKQAAVKTHRRSSRPPPKICRAQVFSYAELERATVGFCKEAEVGRGSYSCVFKGELGDGRVVAVKRAVVAGNMKRDSKEFHREVDLLSRLNHAHLLNLLGYCEEGGERLLVYEFMAHGSLHEHLHGTGKEKLDWIRRVTIAVQAARGLEYLHGYACPPVIHRDIKSSNILIDEEHNARVADFGLSLLGPVDSDNPLSELPAGTLGYLDPEYYRLHYLTTKSDVYSFGVLLLEILSGRKAIDMRYEPGNIVEWAVPLIRGKDIQQILDSSLGPPPNQEALFRIARVACRCVRMRGKERPSMDKVTTSLERALALLMGTPCDEQPILPTEVVLGSSRLHNKSSGSHDLELRAPSWITFPSVASSQRRKSSASEEPNTNRETKFCGNQDVKDGSEIRPASPQRELYLQNNF